MKFTKFHDFEVETSEHKTLSYSKGVNSRRKTAPR